MSPDPRRLYPRRIKSGPSTLTVIVIALLTFVSGFAAGVVIGALGLDDDEVESMRERLNERLAGEDPEQE